jgi:hypothetical protein
MYIQPSLSQHDLKTHVENSFLLGCHTNVDSSHQPLTETPKHILENYQVVGCLIINSWVQLFLPKDQYFTVPLVVRTDSARTAQTTRNPSKVRTESVWSPNKFCTVLVESADSPSRLYSDKFYDEFFQL